MSEHYDPNASFQGKDVALHNLIWWWFQFLMLVPSNILVIYQFFQRNNFENCMYEESHMTKSFMEEIRKKGIEKKMTVLKH